MQTIDLLHESKNHGCHSVGEAFPKGTQRSVVKNLPDVSLRVWMTIQVFTQEV
ncbi:MAG: hypothetical protein CLLPBCKN_004202 [Chroococcidiopsis cubana SAG 39.79]|uniref:hypothetical protein n=1 Tax=Chroococcidiopsis TaxID=54298 RepID=UPI0015E6C35E|nr:MULTISPECIES: hypothetical protein [Chroococcidiopsis]MDZ4874806.1 hypothetical protein [Chroococcidiopsis cubana SAG 39.79]